GRSWTSPTPGGTNRTRCIDRGRARPEAPPPDASSGSPGRRGLGRSALPLRTRRKTSPSVSNGAALLKSWRGGIGPDNGGEGHKYQSARRLVDGESEASLVVA